MAPNLAIEVQDVSASYRIRLDRTRGLRDVVEAIRGAGSTEREVPALQNVTFDVRRGTVLGIIGSNGGGKSTLMRTIAGILAPTTGQVTVRGRIAALLSVGVGMSVALTGRENIKLGGLAIGLSEDRVEEIAEEIAEFAQLGEYVDYPISVYSAGMRSRLGFSVAAHLDPEVLLIDEALTGGDTAYKARVMNKMFDLCSSGRTIVLVSHALTLVRQMSSDCLWLHQGRVAEFGDPNDIVGSYMRYCRVEEDPLGWED